jgi:methionine-rich copper-binding protein CopC
MSKHARSASVLGFILAAGFCMAHARLQSSSPSDSAQLMQAPKSLTLNFSEAARLAVLKLILDGNEVPVPVDTSAPARQSFVLPLPDLRAGKYTVQWTAVAADDGHVTRGTFTFSIAG